MIDKNNFPKQIDELIFYLDDIGGAKLYRELTDEDKVLIGGDEARAGALLVLQFLIIPCLPTKEIADLLSEHLTVGLMIGDLDISERSTKKLISLDLSDRDNCKNALKKALLNNKEFITDEVEVNGKKIKTTADWLKDYISQVGLKRAGSLEYAKYFSEKNYVVNLDDDDKKLLRKIIDLYGFLNISSLTPEGFEDDLTLKDEDGRIITTNKGKVVVLYDPKKTKRKVVAEAPRKATSRNLSEQEKQIINLRKIASGYPADSFERKVIEEEIEKTIHEK